MFLQHPFKKHMCVIFFTLAMISSYVKFKDTFTNPETTETNQTLRADYDFDGLLDFLESNGSDFSEDGEEIIYYSKSFNDTVMVSVPNKKSDGIHTLYLLGLFDLTTRWGKRKQGVSEMLSAQLAVKHVNERNVLPGYKLHLLVNDTQCDTGVGIDNFFHALYSNKTIVMLLGTSCSNVTESLAHVVPYWNVLQDLDTRIIFGSFSEKVAPKIFCEVHTLGMFGADYVWILQDQQEIWWYNKVEYCEINYLHEAVDGLILVADYDKISDGETSISGLNKSSFEEQLNVTYDEISGYVKQAYDAIWAMALTLRESRLSRWMNPLTEFHYGRKDMVCDFVKIMSAMHFTGLSGPVKFSGADRMGNSVIRQIQGNTIADVATFDSDMKKLNFFCDTCKRIKWKNTQVPIAQRKLKIQPIEIPPLLLYVVSIVSLAGILVALIFLYFNLHFRRVKTVKMSSPKLNNVAVIGCVCVYLSVILLSIDMGTLTMDQLSTHLCTARVYLLSAGFSLAFGSIFAKTYRVHRIFTIYGPAIVKDKLLKDNQLIALILTPLVIDAIVLTLWVTTDPLQQQIYNLTSQISSTDRGVVYQPQMKVCRSHNTTGWYIALYGYKGLILIMGVYMAWETRHIKVPALNDSQYIGISVYSAVFSAIITVFSSLASEYVTLSYLAATISILTSTTITLFLLFLPKLRSVIGQVDSEDLIMQSMGLKIESNTRRFVVPDQKELLYRLEVQNKVYKAEIKALDKEIARLEELLLKSPESSKPSTEPYTVLQSEDYLQVAFPTSCRASWPHDKEPKMQPSLKGFSSEDEISQRNLGKLNFLGRIRRIFGSKPSLVMSDTRKEEQFFRVSSHIEKPYSTPEFRSPKLDHYRHNLRASSDAAVNK